MYTIEDLRNGKCAVKNDGTLEELQEVLKLAFPYDWCNNNLSSFCSIYHFIDEDSKSNWLMDRYTNLPHQSVKDFLNQINKKMREITWQQAKQIIDIACPKWRQKLAEQWAINIVFGQDIEISEEFYREMRAACTDAQHKLFDEIFGKDVPECPLKDGEPVWVRDREDQTWLFRYSTGTYENGKIQTYDFQRKSGTCNSWNLHMPFDPNNLPITI